MRVLLLTQIPEVNNKYSFSLARGLKNQGIDVRVGVIETDDVREYTDVPSVPIFESYSAIKNPVSKVLSYKRSWAKVLQYCLSEKIDILHVQWYTFSPLDYIYHKKVQSKGIKIVATIHDLLPFNKKIYDFYFHKKIYKNADCVISQAKANEGELLEKFKLRKDEFRYIPHGHYMDYAEKASKEESREYLNIPKDKKVILFFGQIKKVKGVDILIDALKEISKTHDDILCVIAGKVWKDDFSYYANQIEAYGLNNIIRKDIRFIPDEEIKYYFNAADIVALPYRQIYQSGVVLLAVAYEKPIVATTEGEFLNVIKNRETGLLVPSGKSKEFAEALEWYLQHPKEAIQYGIEAKKDIEVRLNWSTIAKEIVVLYKDIL